MQGSANDVAAPSSRSRKLWKWGIGALVLSWCCALTGILSSLIIPILLVAGIWCIVNRAFRSLLLIFFLNPLSLIFVSGVFSYFLGEPELHGGGWIPGFRKLDRKTRCFYRLDHACTDPAWSGWYHELPHNAAVRLMVALFGYARNAYDGPYPTTAEAVAIVTNAPPTPTALLDAHTVLVDGHEVELNKGLWAACLHVAGFDLVPANRRLGIQATLHQQRCLILHIFNASGSATIDFGMPDTVVLVDYQRMRPIFYEHYFPPERLQ